MKKLKLPAFIAATVFLLSSCQKKYCWQCTMYKLNSRGSFDASTPYKSTVCDKTEKEIEEYENDNTIRESYGTGSQYRSIQTMNCNK